MRVSQEEFEVACEIINKLDRMGLFTAECPHDIDEFEDENEKALDEMGVTLYHGLTKLVIDYWCLDNWVLKVSFCNFRTDYVKLEYEKYQKSVVDGFDFLLAQMEMGSFLKNDGRAFYFQERCNCDPDAQHDSLVHYCSNNIDQEPGESEEEWEERVEDNTYDLCDEECCEAFLGQDYSHQTVDKFIDWCYDNDINDLHSGNFGQREDGVWVVIDYSGFH